MDSGLWSQYGALCIPSTICRLPMLHSNFNSSSLTFSYINGSTRRATLGHAFSTPVISALNKCSTPSENDKDDRKVIVRGMGGASVVLACVLGVMNCNYKFTPKAMAAVAHSSPRPTYAQTPSANSLDFMHPKGAKEILHSLLEMNEHVAGKEHRSSRAMKIFRKKKLFDLPAGEPDSETCDQLKIKAVELIKDGKGDEAVRQLRELHTGLQSAGKTESTYNVEMALVAVLIFQGKYQDASKCGCLIDPPPIRSDDRVHLYKAIIKTMLNQNKEAKKCWEEFINLLDIDVPPTSLPRYK